MTTESCVKQAILHPEEQVRCAALRYFADSCADDTSIMPLVIHAVEGLNRRAAFSLLRVADGIPQTRETVDWLIGELSRGFDFSDLHDDNHRFALALVLAAADPEPLIPRLREILGLAAFPDELRGPLEERLEMHAWPWDRCRDALEAFGRETLARREVTIADHRRLRRILEAAARHRAEAEQYVLTSLRRQYGRQERPLMDWLEPWIIELAGRVKLDKAIPLILRRLEAGDPEVEDAIGNALTRIGGTVVVQAVARAWWRTGSEARLTLCETLENVHCDLAVERARAFFAKETDPEVRHFLAHAILGQFDVAGIEPVRRYVLELDMDNPEDREIRDTLAVAALVMGTSFPELDDWYEQARLQSRSFDALAPRRRIAKTFRGVYFDDPDAAYQLEVTLRDVDPPVWRRLEVPDCSLCELHELLQAAMGWESSHLYAFTVGDDRYADPELMEGDPGFASGSFMRLSDLFVEAGQRLLYEYDFGDGWEHDVRVENILDAPPRAPRCLDGARACPPEDVGGPYGYAAYLQALADPDHEEHDQWLHWRGAFDREAFDLDAINGRLQSFAARDDDDESDDDDDEPPVPLIEVVPPRPAAECDPLA